MKAHFIHGVASDKDQMLPVRLELSTEVKTFLDNNEVDILASLQRGGIAVRSHDGVLLDSDLGTAGGEKSAELILIATSAVILSLGIAIPRIFASLGRGVDVALRPVFKRDELNVSAWGLSISFGQEEQAGTEPTKQPTLGQGVSSQAPAQLKKLPKTSGRSKAKSATDKKPAKVSKTRRSRGR